MREVADTGMDFGAVRLERRGHFAAVLLDWHI